MHWVESSALKFVAFHHRSWIIALLAEEVKQKQSATGLLESFWNEVNGTITQQYACNQQIEWILLFKWFDMLFSLQKQCFSSVILMISSAVISLYYTPLHDQLCLFPHIKNVFCGSVFSPRYRFLELVRPRLAVLERRLRMGVAAVGDVSLGQPCWSKISMQLLLPFFVASIMAVWPWLSFAFTSIPYCREEAKDRTWYLSLFID